MYSFRLVNKVDHLCCNWQLAIISASEVTTVWHYKNSIIIIIIIRQKKLVLGIVVPQVQNKFFFAGESKILMNLVVIQ